MFLVFSLSLNNILEDAVCLIYEKVYLVPQTLGSTSYPRCLRVTGTGQVCFDDTAVLTCCWVAYPE